MKDYAIFLSLTDNYAYLFNALLNSVELFGVGKYADVVIVHDASIKEDYRQRILEKTASMDTDVRFIPIIANPEDGDLGKVLTVKYYRYKIMAEEGQNYKAICFIDTDIFLASGIKEYFDIAAATDLMVGVNDNVVRHYRNRTDRGTCPWWSEGKKPFFETEVWDAKFICNTPLFLDARKHSQVLLDVFEHRQKLGMDNTQTFTGDLETMNIVFNKHGVKERMIVLASHLWTGVHYSIYRVSTLVRHISLGDHIKLSDPSFRNKILFVSDTHEQVRAFHGRDWTCERNEKRLKGHNVPKLLRQMEGKFEGADLERAKAKRCVLFDTIQAYFLFLQYSCYITLDDLEDVIPIRDEEYLKKRLEGLGGIIRKFGRP